jgi:multicomponent K+:H+ antiporter subunit A
MTLVYAAAMALFRNDIKGLLAYSTISQLGLITLLFGLDTPLSVVAALFHIINHAIFKASLFMAAGVIDHECGTRDMRRVNGMFRVMPITATLAIIAAGSMAGVPLLNGFLSKEMFFAETVSAPQFATLGWALPLFATHRRHARRRLLVALCARRVLQWRTDRSAAPAARTTALDARTDRTAGAAVPAGRPVSGLDGRSLLAAAARRHAAGTASGISTGTLARLQSSPVLMSLLALAGGVLIYALRAPLFAWQAQLPPMHARTAFERFYRQLASAHDRFWRCSTMLRCSATARCS